MKKTILILLITISFAKAEVSIGDLAPNFTLPSSEGTNVSLEEFRGKTVVLEWVDHSSPYVRRQYVWEKMQAAQRFAKTNKIVWLSICSSAPNKYGHMTPDQANYIIRRERSPADYYLFDENGTVGRAYGATLTPELFIINPEGQFVYHGSFDDDDREPGPGVEPLAKTKNYVLQALKELIARAPVSIQKTKPIGVPIIYEE